MSPYYYQTQPTVWEMGMELLDKLAFPAALVVCVLIVAVAHVIVQRGKS